MHIHIYALCYFIHYIHVYVYTCLGFVPPPPSKLPLYFSIERVFFLLTRIRHSDLLAHSHTFVFFSFFFIFFSSPRPPWSFTDRQVVLIFLITTLLPFSSASFSSPRFLESLTLTTFGTFADSLLPPFHKLSIYIYIYMIYMYIYINTIFFLL